MIEAEDLQQWDRGFERRGRPSTWKEFAVWLEEYMRLKERWVAFEEYTSSKKTRVPPTLVQSLCDILHFRFPSMREKVEPGHKYAILKVIDRHGTPLIRITLYYDVLANLDGASVVEIGQQLKRAMEQNSHD